MANLSSNGVQDPVAGGYSAHVVKKVQSRPYTPLFKQVYGPDIFTKYTSQQLYSIITEAIGAYEASAEINPFNSKYDASKFGTPPQNLYTLSASEERGRILYGAGPNPSNNPNFGLAQCFPVPLVRGEPHLAARVLDGKDAFRMLCFANIVIDQSTDPIHDRPSTKLQIRVAECRASAITPWGGNYID